MTNKKFGQLALVVICIGIAAMWVYAFIFASKESANKIKDSAWSQRANVICESARTQRTGLQDLRRINITDPAAMHIRADIAEKATTTLTEMLDAIEKSQPTDAKGLALVPLWIADYRVYISDRGRYIAKLRDGKSGRLNETLVEGVPISEKISKFARENRMTSCQVPYDLVS
ncbi:MAG: hypothetical protein EXQ63_00765 [Ilumatobacteraceae bacterium]|nr:hypothetical protein [Ilumatobacteraceae bacterium]